MKTVLSFSWVFLILSVLSTQADWPQWRGPARDGHASVNSVPPETLPTELQPRWKIAIGPGFSSPVVADGKVVYLDDRDGKEVVHVLTASTGAELWNKPIDDSFGDEWGSGPRATPIVDGDRIYVQSCKGEFQCLKLADGRVLWKTNFEKDYGVRFLGSKANDGTAARRGNNGCGMVDGDRIFVPVGSTNGASVVCFDKLNGKELWRSQNDEAAYASFMVATVDNVRQVLAFTADGLIGLNPSSGKLFWRVPLKTNAKRHAATPVVVDDMILVNSHSIGLVATRLTKTPEGVSAAEAWANKKLKTNLATPVLVKGNLYLQGASKDYVCVDGTTGELKWSQPGFGSGTKDYSSTIAIRDRLLVLTEDGTLLLLAANPDKYTELGRLQVCGNTWSFPAFSEGRLYVRDGRSLSCIELVPVKAAAR